MKYLQVLILLIAASCSDTEPKNKIGLTIAPAIDSKKLIETRCYICHNPESISHDEIIAPPLDGVKLRYLTWYPERDAFVNKMSDFIDQPNDSNALMRGAVMQFKTMPDPLLSPAESRAVAEYIYDSELEEPDWFKVHYEEEHGRGKGMN